MPEVGSSKQVNFKLCYSVGCGSAKAIFEDSISYDTKMNFYSVRVENTIRKYMSYFFMVAESCKKLVNRLVINKTNH